MPVKKLQKGPEFDNLCYNTLMFLLYASQKKDVYQYIPTKLTDVADQTLWQNLISINNKNLKKKNVVFFSKSNFFLLFWDFLCQYKSKNEKVEIFKLKKKETIYFVFKGKFKDIVLKINNNFKNIPMNIIFNIIKIACLLEIHHFDKCEIMISVKNLKKLNLIFCGKNDQKIFYYKNMNEEFLFFPKNLEKISNYLILNIHSIVPLGQKALITSYFGPRRIKSHKFHYGIDLISLLNRRGMVLSMEDGIVTKSLFSRSYGNYIIVNHGNGVETLYAHLNIRYVKVGDRVLMGDIIGQVGNTGFSFGPHLHLEIIKNNIKINPINILVQKKKSNDKLLKTKLQIFLIFINQVYKECLKNV